VGRTSIAAGLHSDANITSITAVTPYKILGDSGPN